jgi:hypothetical protein
MSNKVITQIPNPVAPDNTNPNDVQDNILIRTKKNSIVHDSGIGLRRKTTSIRYFLFLSPPLLKTQNNLN